MHLKYAFLFPILFLVACTTTTAYGGTPDPIQVYVNAGSSQATAAAAISTADYYAHQLTATVEAHNMQATERAWSAQSTEQSANSTATARVWEATTTAASVQSTSTAAELATVQAIQATATQHAFDITSTADYAAVQAYATQQFSKAKQAELTIQRGELTNQIRAITPWGMLIVTFLVAMSVSRNWMRVRVIQRDPHGDAPLLLDVVDGVAFDMDRNPAATAGIQREDLKSLPQFSASTHSQIAARDQLLSMASRGLASGDDAIVRRTIAKQIADSSFSSPGTKPDLQVIDIQETKPLFKDVLPRMLEDAIEAEIIVDDQEGELP